MKTSIRVRFLGLLLAGTLAAWGVLGAPALAETEQFAIGEAGLVRYPNVQGLCPEQEPRDVYATCLQQEDVFRSARAHAKARDKLLLVDYGADWCIWCRVIDLYFEGRIGVQYETPTEEHAEQARQLALFLRDTFVLVHINSDKEAEARQVLGSIGAENLVGKPIPAFIVLDPASGATERALLEEAELPVDGSFHGYDRAKLLLELRRATAKLLN